MPHIDPSLPVVGICNIAEPFFDFLNRAQDEDRTSQLVRGEQYRGDRVLVWLGEHKLVYSSFPIPHAEDLYRGFRYTQTKALAPTQPTPWLCRDILREKALLDALIAYAGVRRVVQIVPYANTQAFLELVEALRNQYHLTVLLPETSPPETLWAQRYIDTKVGFRVLAARWLSDADDLLPRGFICHDGHMAAEVALWFLQQGQPCIVKADDGENGIGNVVLRPGAFASQRTVFDHLDRNTFLGKHWLTVEELIVAERLLSPSLECFVPPAGSGEPYVTYLSDQVFEQFGDFCGVLVSRELNATRWYPPLYHAGLTIARHLQELGYVGHFDLDAVVDDNERVYLLEVNARRTGGTHVHEFARHFWGESYLDQVSLLSNDTMKTNGISDYAALRDIIGDLHYPINGERRGVVITITSALVDHEYGCIIVAPTKDETLALQQSLNERVLNARR